MIDINNKMSLNQNFLPQRLTSLTATANGPTFRTSNGATTSYLPQRPEPAPMIKTAEPPSLAMIKP